MRRLIKLAALLLVPLAVPVETAAQTYPTKTVHIVVPNAPGGALDILAQLYRSQFQTLWNQPIVVEYKPGANTVVGTEYVAKSAPDGHYICVIATPHVINPAVRKLPYDTLKDLAAVTLIGTSPILISATTTLPANTIAEVIALARKTGKMNYATAGAGSAMHFAGEALKLQTKVDIQHIAFKGAGPAYPEVISGRIELIIDPLFSSMPHVRGGKLKAIAVTSGKRVAAAPDIPAMGEFLPGFNVESLNGIVVQGGTPRPVVGRINSDFLKIMQAEPVKARMAEFGLIPVGNSPAEFEALLKTEIEKWQRVVKEAKITVDN
jgi:tripartite-type tricarboxylate transporter receptor subunit TctC